MITTAFRYGGLLKMERERGREGDGGMQDVSGPNQGLEFEPFLVWQRRTRLCQPGNRKSEIIDLVQLRGLVGGS